MFNQVKKLIFILIFGLFAFPVFAQEDKMALTITPPLIKNNVNPGQIWKSSIKLINNNPNEITIYVQVQDFKGGSDSGTVEFISDKNLKEEDRNFLMSSWIVIDEKSIKIPAFKSYDIPFIIDVPEDASPGGHYAAIMVGTAPINNSDGGSVIKVSSLLSSLILLNVKGEIDERGQIREFSTDKSFYTKPDVKFNVKFENLGNVHVQPKGEIKVYNFFGKEKEVITLNHGNYFGNVLPKNSRSWSFDWQGEENFLDMGRYRAELVVGYGNESLQTTDRTIYFWIVYIKPLIYGLSSLFVFFLMIFLAIRSYIRKSLKAVRFSAGNKISRSEMVKRETVNFGGEKKAKDDVLDLRGVEEDEKQEDKGSSKKSFLKWIIIVVLLSLIGIIAWFYVVNHKQSNNIFDNEKQAQTEKQDQIEMINDFENEEQVQIENQTTNMENAIIDQESVKGSSTQEVATTTEEVLINQEEKIASGTEVLKKEALYIKVLNGGGIAGAASKVVDIVKKQGYLVAKIGNADNFDYAITEISYKLGMEDYANDIKASVDRKSLIKESEEQEEDIVIIIGKSLE